MILNKFTRTIKEEIDSYIKNENYDEILKIEGIEEFHNDVFSYGCKNDKNLPLLKLLDTKFEIDYLYNKYVSNLNCLEIACSYCNFSKEIIKWIFDKMILLPKYLDFLKGNNQNILSYCFGYLTENLDLDMMKYFYYKAKENDLYINIQIDNDEAFRYSCRSDRLDIAQWIYSVVNIDLYSLTEYEVECCINNRLGYKMEKSLPICIESYKYDAIEVAEWIVRSGYKPPNEYKDHDMYKYWQEYKLKYMIGIFALIKIQQTYKQKLYNPENGVLMEKAKKRFNYLNKNKN